MDDMSPVPMPPSLDLVEVDDHAAALQEDKEAADAFFHPAWAAVEKMFQEELETFAICPDEKLDAVDYKTIDLANKRAASAVARVWERVRDAVSAVESAERTNGSPGGK